MTEKIKVATGLAKGRAASPMLIESAIRSAMAKAEIHHASSALLFLTSEFANDPLSAIRAAAITASSTQIIGCSASGIFTEENWVLDGAAAAVMVFSEDILTNKPKAIKESELLLTLAAPSAINASWLNHNTPRFGGVSGDATGRGPFSVWQNGKGITQGYCELGIQNSRVSIATSHGLKLISSPRRVTATNQYELITIANISALRSLISASAMDESNLPYHLLMVAYAKTAQALENGQYQISSLIVANEETQSITLSSQLQEGDWLCWAMRDVTSAQEEMSNLTHQLQQSLDVEPDFGMMFSCLGRGPYFYNGTDQDLNTLKKAFPNLPIIGFYGNGQISPSSKCSLLQYSTVIGLFKHGLLSAEVHES